MTIILPTMTNYNFDSFKFILWIYLYKDSILRFFYSFYIHWQDQCISHPSPDYFLFSGDVD